VRPLAICPCLWDGRQSVLRVMPTCMYADCVSSTIPASVIVAANPSLIMSRKRNAPTSVIIFSPKPMPMWRQTKAKPQRRAHNWMPCLVRLLRQPVRIRKANHLQQKIVPGRNWKSCSRNNSRRRSLPFPAAYVQAARALTPCRTRNLRNSSMKKINSGAKQIINQNLPANGSVVKNS
jgi:hypothetical protein